MVEQTPELVKQSDEQGNTLLAIACQNNRKVGARPVTLLPALKHGGVDAEIRKAAAAIRG